MKRFAVFLAVVSAAITSLLFVRNKAPKGFMLWFPKLFAGAAAPFTALAGAGGAALGLLSGSPLAVFLGSLAAASSLRYVQAASASHHQFERMFGLGWEDRLSPELKARMLRRHWTWRLPASPRPTLEQDNPFWTIPGAQERNLLCDVWMPPTGTPRSGLALLFFHGSAWTMLDKDVGTRPFFRRLAAQGHVVMDVAYRLFPETDMAGMVGDVKRAVTWMKANAVHYGVNPERIVLGGASAGGQLSMLAAYAPDDPALTPEDVRGQDLSVRGVVSLYGPADLEACYFHTSQDKTTRGSKIPAAAPNSESGLARPMQRLMGANYHRLGMDKPASAGAFAVMLGGHPDEVPEAYRRFSPIGYIHPGCPPTLLIQGEDDLITPVMSTFALYRKLMEARVPVLCVAYPQTDHGFDLMLPEVSPTAQAALYDIERFLALMV
jgi:acetyl esterase/lipase